jgi:Fe-S-cluster containining protein
MKRFRTTKPCACEKCKGACAERPGWPTPEEAERIIKAGMAKRLMYDWWAADDDMPETGVLCPAAPGCGGKRAPQIGFIESLMGLDWRCSFLKRNGKCELHGTDMKPFECRVSMPCKDARGDLSIHQEAAKRWNTIKGKEVLILWAQAVKTANRRRADRTQE